jgi:predicted DNA-binding antitoxin AbrB/MazE fold protein
MAEFTLVELEYTTIILQIEVTVVKYTGGILMAETITARYESGVLIPLENLDLREHQTVRLQIVPPQVRITASEARRKVSRFLLDQVSYVMGAEQPTLTETDRLLWRVPVVLTYPDQGTVGKVGYIDVDAEHGTLLSTPETIQELQENARALAAHSPS